MPDYRAYGLHFHSRLELPELPPAEGAGDAPDVRIELGAVAADGLDAGRRLGPYLRGAPGRLWLHIPGVGRFLVEDGRRITVDPDPGTDAATLRVYLLGSVLGALLFQRGLLVIHGNAIRMGDRCLLCVGDSGAGKSTLAAAFLRRGHQILADDVVPVDAHCRAIPGFGRIKLWQDAAESMGIDPDGLQRIHPGVEKFNYSLGDGFCTEPLPVRWIYILDSQPAADFRLIPIGGLERFRPLYENTYRAYFLQGMSLEPQHLGMCGKLASSIHLTRLVRPERGYPADVLAERISAHVAANP